MTKAKLNIIKLNIIKMILALICISCAPFSKIDPKVAESSKLKKNTKLKNNTDLGENTQNFKDESGDLSPSDQKFMGTKDSELKEIGKKLADQRKEENTQINKMTKEESSLLDPYIGAYPALVNEEDEKMLLKRMLYSSLDYKKENIETLKKILETLIFNPKNDPKIAAKFLFRTALGIQKQLENHLKSINEKLDTLNKEDLKGLPARAKSALQLKEVFKKNLNKTLEDYRKNTNNIQEIKVLAEHFNQYYQDPNTLKPIS
ncbi:complement regulator-acquiring protein [Borreliella lanei]|uniref:Acyl-[acyl carrier protein]--UDP-N-acetylglucosamine O-acyltransferase n=1 Tax=Borreliella lanei TaxID=373540 RepID=A0A7W9ZBH8_9SPIR|nr:complement regulator-acquiring protein [Borreliella lanei]MBB6208330.1 acyl-[acyl carrier protein]--UDP-N-acetylglucosamine O-acyltransferase [Borreliella lanei]WKC85859.1 complement regulator-acquiring protein [Borreliella lanei]